MNIEWGDLPETRNGSGQPWVAPVIEELKQRPGQWAKVRTYPGTSHASPMQARLKQRGCEAAQRKNADGGTDLWARWPEDAA